MRKYLSSGVEANIVQNETGGFDVGIIYPPETYNSKEEFLKAKYDKIYGALVALKREGIFNGSFSNRYSEIDNLSSRNMAGLQTPAKKKASPQANGTPGQEEKG